MSAGNDTIFAGRGNNLIDLTGAGNDTVKTGRGNDTFILSLGAGVATIYGYGANDRIDVMDLTGVTLTQSGNNTLIGVGSDKLAILDQTSVSSVTFV